MIDHTSGLARWRAAVLLIGVVGAIACGRDRVNPPAAEREQYDGETLYRGLFFGKGAVAKLFPDIWGPDESQRASTQGSQVTEGIAAEEQHIVETIGSHVPGFFEQFVEDVTSGNHARVQEAIRRAANATTDALADSQYEMWGPFVNGIGCDLSVYIIVSNVVVIEGPTFVVCIYVLSPKEQQLTAMTKLGKDGHEDLQTDYLIDLVTLRLARQSTQERSL